MIGFVALYLGAEWLVEGAADIAAHLNVSKAFVGLTLVAFGTSAPELFVNVIAAFHDHFEFALANVAGSNLTNLCLGFGISALLVALPVARSQFAVDLVMATLGPLVVLSSLLVTRPMVLHWSALAPMAVILAVYLVSLVKRLPADEAEDPTHLTMRKPLILFASGVAALYIGGKLVFTYATQLAEYWQVPEQIVGLTLVACGTSIPDVAATIVAARRREFAIAVGNLLGSNISNVFVVLSSTLLVAGKNLSAAPGLLKDYVAVTTLSALFAVSCVWRQRVPRLVAALLLVAFCGYYAVRTTLLA
jgi:cation:H+ antiporter